MLFYRKKDIALIISFNSHRGVNIEKVVIVIEIERINLTWHFSQHSPDTH
jgi:hypothetical protein